eukprot:CAMPEP_0171352736 /NCGR_PEP_ID=MMETSP0878-20121228/42428_1 /TAXON_ID=67004 /ORGANISM="Thalassiosira weissflogii, Strain CCMP1336" /LENGTH=71 /DNA_ID=CAMNT_0011858477 /DNA_START=112 /DNA_END=330 /DNA_ORIENTATION=+
MSSNIYNMQVSDETGATWVVNLAKHLLADTGINSMMAEQWHAEAPVLEYLYPALYFLILLGFRGSCCDSPS